MRYLMFTVFALLISARISAQISIETDYVQLRSRQWDDIIRTYNFARPWRDEKQPFLTHGFSASLGWYFRLSGKKSTFLKPVLFYNRHGSTSTFNSQTLSLTVEQYSFKTDFNWNPSALMRDVSAGPLGTRFFISISPGISFWSATVKRNDEVYISSKTEKYKPYNFSYFLGAGLGYRAMMLAKTWVVSPVLRVNYYPKAEIQQLAQAIQGADQTDLLNQARNVLTIQAGLEFTKIFAVKKSSKGYGIGSPNF